MMPPMLANLLADASTPRVLHVMHFFDGVTLALAMIAALAFLRYFRRTRDRMFLFFAAAFFLYGLNRIVFQFRISAGDFANMWLYVIRIIAFAIVIAGVVDKNRRSRRPSSP
jgi:hypothetical protein